MKKVVIEDASVELLELFDDVGKEARIEKTAIPPINKMIYWWTRKPLIVGRAMALASTLDNIEDVKSLLGLNTENRAYKYIPDNFSFLASSLTLSNSSKSSILASSITACFITLTPNPCILNGPQ